ncbi:MAG: CPBP family intramembrane metalloprotease, partial [Rhizobiaceae bacterium]|nr:CPBP family intramembrane metalloprotease [Rhizobiaceae bacterium]
LGLAAKPDGALVLGTFALLTVIDQILKRTLGEATLPDPTGGLSPMESGPWGLILALTSACLAAPVAEEILYRGVLFRSLSNRLRVPAAVVFSSVIFAIGYGLLRKRSLPPATTDFSGCRFPADRGPRAIRGRLLRRSRGR